MKLILSQLANEKLFTWIDYAQGECSGLGIVKVLPDSFLVTDLFICQQKNSGSETELNAEALCKLAMKVHEDKLTDGKETFLKLHWHSHVNMSVFRSGTDNAMINQLSEFGWHLFLIANKRREFHAVFRDPHGAKLPYGVSALEYDKIPVEIETIAPKEKEAWIAELKACEITHIPTWNASRNCSSLEGGAWSPHWGTSAENFYEEHQLPVKQDSAKDWRAEICEAFGSKPVEEHMERWPQFSKLSRKNFERIIGLPLDDMPDEVTNKDIHSITQELERVHEQLFQR